MGRATSIWSMKDSQTWPIPTSRRYEVVTPNTGRVVIVSLYEETPRIDLNDLVTKNHALYGVFAYGLEDFLESIELLASGKIDRKPLITHRFSLDQAGDAFETQSKTTDCFKVVINP